MPVAEVVAAFAAGIVVGILVAVILIERAQVRMARYQRTGSPAVAPVGVAHLPGGEFAGPTTLERAAQERAYEAVVARGAEEFQRLEPRLTPAEARRKAIEALDALGAFNRGGGVPGV